MRSAKLYRYRLPMDSGVIVRNERLKERVGWVVELLQNGKVGRGEIAPLPTFSLEDADQAGAQAQAVLATWVSQQGESSFADLVSLRSLYPSVAFGLSMAELELRGELPEAGNYTSAPLCSGDPDELLPVFSAMAGQKVAKVKVGLYEVIRDGMLTNLFLESIADLTLRLDANQAWSKEKAIKFAHYITPSLRQRIAFLEEPCSLPSDSLSFAFDTGIAIAWDETLQQAVRQSDFSLDTLVGAKAIVIKPTLIGSVDFCIELIQQAQKMGIQPVISSSLESSLGLSQLARLAKWQLPDEVPGLDTIGLFKTQLVTPWPESDLPLQELSDHELIWQS
ncbi:o-succinylbenzoate synthase [Vibrio sp. 10N.286.49.B3]|uniref:o-succinylbenzoate synthase n=1 Tax=Vibrio sp. 10N.286.49.B3 TaxID=1880855 RepID=UPI000C861543|nr:o-succinylbenzoate synthase [Vibrio sp. 10N.286.49.B3]PMH41866.1 o-succinylbenzoate synthase [Vibrio sp. 10N.286.49.B3]